MDEFHIKITEDLKQVHEDVLESRSKIEDMEQHILELQRIVRTNQDFNLMQRTALKVGLTVIGIAIAVGGLIVSLVDK